MPRHDGQQWNDRLRKAEDKPVRSLGGVVPDIIRLSKTLGAGYPPSAVVASRQIADTCARRGFFFCTTNTNDPLAAVGTAVLEVVIRDRLAQRIKTLGRRLVESLRELQRGHHGRYVVDVRGRGLLIGLEVGGRDFGRALRRRMWDAGLSLHFSPDVSTFRIAPPLTTSDDEFGERVDIVRAAYAAEVCARP